MLKAEFWKGKRVFVTGHTGFKGSWLTVWLNSLGARVAGYALEAPTSPSLYSLCSASSLLEAEHISDIRNYCNLSEAVAAFQPDIVMHLAAQSLVQESYRSPLDTYSTNVMGTVHILESIRHCASVQAVIIVTTDKCYENKEWLWGYRENDRLGGFDPYSNSKACAELVTNAYIQSFFSTSRPAVASVRAGNVIGGGDWAENRLIPDCVRAFLKGDEVTLRNPSAIRPWQHVLEPLYGYLLLAEKLIQHGQDFSGPWNFGPDDDGIQNVGWVANALAGHWFAPARCKIEADPTLGHETSCLKLSSVKAKELLGWKPLWSVDQALKKIAEWTRAYQSESDMRAFTAKQIEAYMEHWQ